MIESLAKDLPGLGLDPRSSAYDLLGGSHEQDDNSNRTSSSSSGDAEPTNTCSFARTQADVFQAVV
jgi:hypothetical protein